MLLTIERSQGSPADQFINDGLTNFSNDQLYGEGGRDVIEAGGGEDALFGGEGDDLLIDGLYGTGEWDFLDGGTGNDYIAASKGDDVALGGEGDDTLLEVVMTLLSWIPTAGLLRWWFRQ